MGERNQRIRVRTLERPFYFKRRLFFVVVVVAVVVEREWECE